MLNLFVGTTGLANLQLNLWHLQTSWTIWNNKAYLNNLPYDILITVEKQYKYFSNKEVI